MPDDKSDDQMIVVGLDGYNSRYKLLKNKTLCSFRIKFGSAKEKTSEKAAAATGGRDLLQRNGNNVFGLCVERYFFSVSLHRSKRAYIPMENYDVQPGSGGDALLTHTMPFWVNLYRSLTALLVRHYQTAKGQETMVVNDRQLIHYIVVRKGTEISMPETQALFT